MRETYELKYCERCGSLRLRRSQSAENYCEPCGRMLLNYSSPNLALRQATARKNEAEVPVPFKLGAQAQSWLWMGRLQ
jgi:hypothetical protein